jgi:hypothetical protein
VLTIDELRLVLPDGFAHRAEPIARLVGEALARRAPAVTGRFAEVAVPRVAVPAGASDADVAARIADAIHAGIAAAATRGGRR